MKFANLPAFRALTTLAFACLITVLGCSDDGMGKRFPVSGTVTYKGEPVKKGSIIFINEDTNIQPASGTIEDGSFSLTTLTPGDGCFPGKYMVTVNSKVPDMAAAEEGAKKKGNTSAYIPQDFIGKAYKAAKSELPEKYSAANTSGLKFEVLPQSNSFEIKLVD